MKPTLVTKPGRAPRSATLAVTLAAALFTMFAASSAFAQAAEPAPAVTPIPDAALTPEELEKLVARIALYPDDLVALILPASTNPLQMVQADRYLAKRKTDPKLPLDDKWDDPVKSLLNYPEVVTMMSNDLDWTAALGEAVVADQGEVLEAVQAFRRKTQSAGNLKSDPKQTVVVEKEVIKIVPTDPQVIYVPQYNPTTVVVSGGYYGWGYYPTPYPVYYYPYAPGAAFATGLIWGAAIGAAWNGGHWGASYGGNNNINVNRNTNINTGDIGSGNRPSNQPAGGRGNNSSQWKSNKQPGQVSRSVGATPTNRTGDRAGGVGGPSAGTSDRGGGGRGGSAGPSAGTSDRGGGGGGRGAGPSAGTSDRGGGGGGGAGPSAGTSNRGGGAGGGGGGAFDGHGSSGRQTHMDSSRGASSRSSMGASSSMSNRGGGGGGGRGGGGGGRGGGGRR